MTTRKRNLLLTVTGRAGMATVRGIAPIVATAAAASVLAGVVAIPVDKYLKSLDSVY